MIGGRRSLQGRKPGDRRVRVERPHAPYFRYTGEGTLTAKEAALLAELEALGRTVARAKAEIAALRVDDITSSHIPSATDELDAIVAHTAQATNEILDCCEVLEGLQGAMAGPQAEALRAAIESLPADEITAEERERCCAANLEGARARFRGVNLSTHFEQWRRGLSAVQCFRTLDGNIARREPGPRGRWLRLRDDVGEAARVAGQFAVDPESRESAPPVPGRPRTD